jgi:hypothetical protein
MCNATIIYIDSGDKWEVISKGIKDGGGFEEGGRRKWGLDIHSTYVFYKGKNIKMAIKSYRVRQIIEVF